MDRKSAFSRQRVRLPIEVRVRANEAVQSHVEEPCGCQHVLAKRISFRGMEEVMVHCVRFGQGSVGHVL